MPPRGSRAKARKSLHRKPAGRRSPQRWSARVTRTSDALDLEVRSVQPEGSEADSGIAEAISRAEHAKEIQFLSIRVSMLTFYINRAGTNLSAAKRRILQQAKDELRRQFKRA